MALIYIVEDDEPIRRELVDILARAGFEIEACESFEHVSRDILAAAPDLVLLDLTLPVKDGQHICHEVRRESEVPIIVLTSRTTEIDEVMAMTLGAAAGALLNIDGAIHRLGTWVEAHVHRHEGGPSLAEGFVTASLLCCVGAMAVNGSLDAGIRGDNSILLTKSMIDLVFCAMLATTLGAGVMLAGAAVFVVEGALTLLAGAIAPLLSEAAVADLTCAGSLLVAAIGLNQTGATKIKVADYLPALLFVPLIRWLVSLPVWQQITAWF